MKTTRGFTLMEVIIFSSLTAVAFLIVSKFLMRIPQAQHLMAVSEIPTEGKHAMDLWTSDIKEAVPNSFDWEVQPATAPLRFTKPWQDPKTKIYESLLMFYAYEGPEKGLGALVRVVESSETVVLDQIEPATDKAPIFTLDPALHIVMIDVTYHPTGRPPVRFVRRMAITR